MKVLFFTIGNKEVASSRTRVYQYLPYLIDKGIKCKVIFHIASWQSKKVIGMKKISLLIKLCAKLYSSFKTAIFIILAPQYDILFIQRVMLPLSLQKLILLLNKKVIFDFDDAIYLADLEKRSFLNTNKFLKRFQYMLKGSDCVLVANEILKKPASQFNSNVIILPTPVDTERLTPKAEQNYKASVVVGWIGSPETTKYIGLLKRPLEFLAEKFPFLRMQLVGGSSLQGWKINLLVKEWSWLDELEDLRGFDIGIMPLTDDEWSKAKAGYKLLQYMTVGIPCVASPVGINCELIQDGVNGFLAGSQEEWSEKLGILLQDRQLRLKMGRAGRQMVERGYSYQALAPRLFEVFKGLYESEMKE